MDSWLGWKRWLGRALCPRAGAVGGRLPSASQQMPQLELRLYFYAPSLHQCSLPWRGALWPEPSVTLRMLRGPGSRALPRREALGQWASLASFTRSRDSDPSPSKERKGAGFFAFLSFPPSLSLASPPGTGSPRGVFPWEEKSQAGNGLQTHVCGVLFVPPRLRWKRSEARGAHPWRPTQPH